MSQQLPSPYDAFLLLSFGGPENNEEVIPFLEHVLTGKRVPRERLEAVAKHYYHFGGKSPINEQNRSILSRLQTQLEKHGPALPTYFGNLHSKPFLTETVTQMKNDGVKRALVFATSAFSSFSGCKKYRIALEEAQQQVGPGAPELDKLRLFFNHPGFIKPVAEYIEEALSKLSVANDRKKTVLFTAHSIPLTMAKFSEYEAQLKEACALVMQRVKLKLSWKLTYQSRSGPPTQPWLEPDIADALRTEKQRGTEAVVVCPIGFISDHMEVLWDLDEEAASLSQELGIKMVRAKTASEHDAFIGMIRDLMLERIDPTLHSPKRLGTVPPWPNECHCQCGEYLNAMVQIRKSATSTTAE